MGSLCVTGYYCGNHLGKIRVDTVKRVVTELLGKLAERH